MEKLAGARSAQAGAEGEQQGNAQQQRAPSVSHEQGFFFCGGSRPAGIMLRALQQLTAGVFTALLQGSGGMLAFQKAGIERLLQLDFTAFRQHAGALQSHGGGFTGSLQGNDTLLPVAGGAQGERLRHGARGHVVVWGSGLLLLQVVEGFLYGILGLHIGSITAIPPGVKQITRNTRTRAHDG